MKRLLSIICLLSVLASLSGFARAQEPTSGDIEEIIKQVVADTQFEHIWEHTRFGVYIPPKRLTGEGLDNTNAWLKFFKEKGNEDFLPEGMRFFASSAEPVNMKWLLRDLAPSYLACMDHATKQCNRLAFTDLMQAYRNDVLQSLTYMETQARRTQAFYQVNYQMYHEVLKDNITSLFRDVATKKVGMSNENAYRLEQAYNAYQAFDNSRDLLKAVQEIGFHGVSEINPLTAIPMALWDIIDGISELWGYRQSRIVAVRALAYLKLYLLYEHRVLPYIARLKGATMAPLNRADERFSEKYCWTCDSFRPDAYPDSPFPPRTVCPHYYEKQAPFAAGSGTTGTGTAGTQTQPGAQSQPTSTRPVYDQPRKPLEEVKFK